VLYILLHIVDGQSSVWFSHCAVISCKNWCHFVCWWCRLHNLLSRNALVEKFIAELEQFDQPNAVFKVSLW